MSVFTNPASAAGDQAKAYVTAVLGLLGSTDPMDVLRQTPSTVQRKLGEMSAAEINRPEAPGKWSVGQVMQHLADSELVWGYRLRMVLSHDRPPLTGYDQDLWADRLGYRDADAQEASNCFAVLRRSNLRLLDRATDADLLRVGVHAERGEERLDHMVRLYAGHDLLHLNQVDRIRGSLKPEV
jgi:hypothetical protein